MSDVFEGGCLCGRLRYRAEGRPLDAGWCHCRLCQKSSGAPALAWGTWPAAAVRYTAGEPRVFKSSARGRRHFCPDCGTQLLFRVAEDSRTIDLTLASLDRPDAIVPEYHIWTASQIAWMELADQLPRHADGGPDTWD